MGKVWFRSLRFRMMQLSLHSFLLLAVAPPSLSAQRWDRKCAQAARSAKTSPAFCNALRDKEPFHCYV